MNKTITNKTIRTHDDVYSYITALCLKSDNYTKEDIFNIAKVKLCNSALRITEKKLKEMINGTFDFLERYQLIVKENDTYTKRKAKTTSFELF